MDVKFFSSEPRRSAWSYLDDILGKGNDQVSIACAFLTSGGADLIKRHAKRLKLEDSFLVVAWEYPTNENALNDLYALFPNNLYIHLGAKTPKEKEAGRGLMHSKVFFARDKNQCWLWTGSHNLTASATMGVNCEAAVVLEGSIEEEPFQAALAHLEQCKKEAIVFNPHELPEKPDSESTLIIHAERHTGLKDLPWYVHLRLATTDYDTAMRPAESVWLYLYPPGSLKHGMRRPKPTDAYSGVLTALNFTERHPEKGIPADWREADYVIQQSDGIFCLDESRPDSEAKTQGVFRIDKVENPETIWLSKSPTPTLKKEIGKVWEVYRAPEFLKYFTKQSVRENNLVHRQYSNLRLEYSLKGKEAGHFDEEEVMQRLDMPNNTYLTIKESEEMEDKFAFIYKAKYRSK